MRCREIMRLMDSGTCAKRSRSPDLHRKEHVRRKYFPGGGPTVVKHNFTNSNLRDKHFSSKKLIEKYQISKSSGGLPRFFVCWCFVSKLWYLGFAGWSHHACFHSKRRIRGRYLVRARGDIECSNSWIYWMLRRCPWNGHGKSLLGR